MMSAVGASPGRMVHLRTVADLFHARVIAARLGADGILCELRGNTGGLYPFGPVSVWVAEGEAVEAADLLLADEVEAALDPACDQEAGPCRRRWRSAATLRRLAAVIGVVLALCLALGGHLGG